jgi:hypothetical protein
MEMAEQMDIIAISLKPPGRQTMAQERDMSPEQSILLN